jgi:hypothetical protein
LQANPCAVDVHNDQGHTPLDVAYNNRYPDLYTIERLIEASPKVKKGKHKDGKLPCKDTTNPVLSSKLAAPPLASRAMPNVENEASHGESLPQPQQQPTSEAKEVKLGKDELNRGVLHLCRCKEGCNCNRYFFCFVKGRLKRSEACTMNQWLNDAVKHTLAQKKFLKTLEQIENQSQTQHGISRAVFGAAMEGFMASCKFADKILKVCGHSGSCINCNRNHPIFKTKTDWREEIQNACVAQLNMAIRSCTELSTTKTSVGTTKQPEEVTVEPDNIQSRFKNSLEAALFQGNLVVTAKDQVKTRENNQKQQDEINTLKSKHDMEPQRHSSELKRIKLAYQRAADDNSRLDDEINCLEEKLSKKEEACNNRDALLDHSAKYIEAFVEDRLLLANLAELETSPEEIVKILAKQYNDPASVAKKFDEEPEIILVMIEEITKLLEKTSDEYWKNKENLLEQLETLVLMVVEKCTGDESNYSHLRLMGKALLRHLTRHSGETFEFQMLALEEDSDMKLLPHINASLLEKIRDAHCVSQVTAAMPVISMQPSHSAGQVSDLDSAGSVNIAGNHKGRSSQQEDVSGDKAKKPKSKKRTAEVLPVKMEMQEMQEANEICPGKRLKGSKDDPIIVC